MLENISHINSCYLYVKLMLETKGSFPIQNEKKNSQTSFKADGNDKSLDKDLGSS
jgi:hypothetical protein